MLFLGCKVEIAAATSESKTGGTGSNPRKPILLERDYTDTLVPTRSFAAQNMDLLISIATLSDLQSACPPQCLSQTFGFTHIRILISFKMSIPISIYDRALRLVVVKARLVRWCGRGTCL